MITEQHIWERQLVRADPERHQAGHNRRRHNDDPRHVSAARSRDELLAGVFLAGAFLAGVFLAGVFLAGAFLAGVFLAGALLGRRLATGVFGRESTDL